MSIVFIKGKGSCPISLGVNFWSGLCCDFIESHESCGKRSWSKGYVSSHFHHLPLFGWALFHPCISSKRLWLHEALHNVDKRGLLENPPQFLGGYPANHSLITGGYQYYYFSFASSPMGPCLARPRHSGSIASQHPFTLQLGSPFLLIFTIYIHLPNLPAHCWFLCPYWDSP